jgi:riboflavin kinase/FMN adenylyltransferase
MLEHWINGLENVPGDCRGGVVTIGNFDGCHLGHQQIIAAARALAAAEDLPVTAVTFDPPPDLVIRPDDAPQLLSPPAFKSQLLLDHGADWVVTIAATMDLLSMSPEAFIDEIIVGRFAPRHMVEGHDFFFGAKRAGNVELLAQAGSSRGFDVCVVDPITVEIDGESQRVSSTLVRSLVGRGDLPAAIACLGRPFTLFGQVVRGEGRGRQLGFPTANLDTGRQMPPADAVYAGAAYIGGEEYAAAVSIGTKPTFAQGPHTVEVYLIDAPNTEYYGQLIGVALLEKLRDQIKYDSAEDLVKQMQKDVQRVRELCQ